MPDLQASEDALIELARAASAGLEHCGFCIARAREKQSEGDLVDALNFSNHARYYAEKSLDNLREIVKTLDGILAMESERLDEAERERLIRERNKAARAACVASGSLAEVKVVRSDIIRQSERAAVANA